MTIERTRVKTESRTKGEPAAWRRATSDVELNAKTPKREDAKKKNPALNSSRSSRLRTFAFNSDRKDRKAQGIMEAGDGLPTAYFGGALRSRLFILAIVLIFSADLALADNSSFDEMLKIDTPKIAATSPDQYRWSIEVLATGLGDVTNRHVVMGGMTGGVGYYIFPQVAIQLDVTGYGFSEGRSSGAAAGVTLGIRHHIASIGKNSVFLDVAGGEIEASNNIPYGGTHLNNTIQFGFGVAHPISDNMYLLAGARYYHISNASSEGGDRNPSVNALQGFVGLMWRF